MINTSEERLNARTLKTSVSSFSKSSFKFIKHPVVLIIIIGLLIRFVVAPILTYGYDVYHWALIIENFRSGNGLYELAGYYYTPVWGYLLGFFSAFQEMFLNIDLFGVRFEEVLFVESYTDWYLTSTITTVAFNFFIKVPFIICDLLVGYLIYWIIKYKTGNIKKATIGFALWFLCPFVISVANVGGMFDTFLVLFLLLTLIFMVKGHYFWSGVFFSISVLAKFFPIFLIFILIVYILKKHKGDGLAMRNLSMAIFGAAIAFIVIMLPQMLDGTFFDTFSFLTSRASEGVGSEGDVINFGSALVLTYIGMIIVSIIIAIGFYKRKTNDLNNCFMICLTLMVCILYIVPSTPQYILMLVPFLIYCIITYGRKYMIPWIILAVGTTMFSLFTNSVLLLSIATFTDFLTIEQVTSWVAWSQSPLFFGHSFTGIVYIIGTGLQYIGTLILMFLFFKSIIRMEKKRKSDPGLNYEVIEERL